MATKLYRTLRVNNQGPDVHGAKRCVYKHLAKTAGGTEGGKWWAHYRDMPRKRRELFGLTFLRHLLKCQAKLGIAKRYRGRFTQHTLDALRKKDAVDKVADNLFAEAWPPPIPARVHPIPAGHQFSIIGYPGYGTHNASDWQSRNALDFKADSGTPILAPRAGRVYRVGGTDGIRIVGVKIIFGRKFTIITDEGPDIFLTHLAGLTVREGQRVTAGQVVGKIGRYGAGSHAHIAFEYGDPRDMLDWKRIKV